MLVGGSPRCRQAMARGGGLGAPRASRGRDTNLLSKALLPSTPTNNSMESLDGTQWDVVIAGTGLPQSLLAL